jgi:hypothetical protein
VDRRRVGPEVGVRLPLEQRFDERQRVASVAEEERVLVVIEVAQLDRGEERAAVVVVGRVDVRASFDELGRERDLSVQERDEERRRVIAR